MAGVLQGEPHIGQGRVGELSTGRRHRRDEGRGQQLEPLGGQRGEQAPAVGEMVGRGGVRHSGIAREFAQRNPFGAALGHGSGGFGQDDGPQIAVVVGRPAHAEQHSEQILTMAR